MRLAIKYLRLPNGKHEAKVLNPNPPVNIRLRIAQAMGQGTVVSRAIGVTRVSSQTRSVAKSITDRYILVGLLSWYNSFTTTDMLIHGPRIAGR